MSANLDSCIESAATWAEDFSRRMQEVYANINPNR
jgi:hypothetical protein